MDRAKSGDLLGSPSGWVLLVRNRNGFSLVELMIVVAIVAVLLLIAAPNFASWMNNARIRSAAESIQDGLRIARNEAAQRGTKIRFELASATAASWTVCQLPSTGTACTASGSTVIETRGATESQVTLTGSTKISALTSTATVLSGGIPGGVTFDPLARPSGYGTDSLTRVDVDGVKAGRRLVLLVSSGGMVRECDPSAALASTDALSCGTN